MINDMMSGLNGDMRVTPVTLSGTTRVEIPSAGVENQLFRRKTIAVQNTSSGTLYVGDESVGYGVGFGGGDSTTCSGVRIESGDLFTLDGGRVRLYAFNSESYEISFKVLEVS